MIRIHPRAGMLQGATVRASVLLALAAAGIAGCQSSTPAATPTTAAAPTAAAAPTVAAAAAPTAAAPAAPAPTKTGQQPVAGGPVLLRDGITLRKVTSVDSGAIKIALNPVDKKVYLLNPNNGLFTVDLTGKAAPAKVAATTDIVPEGVPAGMAFGPDGALYVVANRKVGENQTQALIRKGVAAGDTFTWTTLASTVPYPLSNTPFDHLYNGVAVSPDGKSVYVNAGSRSDHGEVENNNNAFPDLREIPLTSAIFRIPADSKDLELKNDEAALKPYLFADGTRNSYDPEFAPNGDLFAGDNGPDADFPDELNWLREGMHYGFPWRFGTQDNPQQFPGYDGSKDVHLSQDFTAVKTGTYKNDPTFPKPPGAFTDPVINVGPDAAQYRGDDGKQHDAAAEGKPLNTFTPHRSPLGLVFATDAKLPADLAPASDGLSAFVLSWGSAGGTLTDAGQDLLHLKLTKKGDNYESATTQIARGFKNPIAALMIENRLYVLEFGENSAIWELTFG